MDDPQVTESTPHPGERVLLLRNRRAWTQHTLAVKAGLKVDTIRRIERGADVRRGSLERVAKALDTTVSHLYVPLD